MSKNTLATLAFAIASLFASIETAYAGAAYGEEDEVSSTIFVPGPGHGGSSEEKKRKETADGEPYPANETGGSDAPVKKVQQEDKK